MVTAEGANPPPRMVSLIVKYPFFMTSLVLTSHWLQLHDVAKEKDCDASERLVSVPSSKVGLYFS